MATYILLSSLTDEGRKTLKERPERLQEVNRELEGMGARVTRQYATLGPYDFFNVVEAPDNETITRVAVELGTRGTIRLTTLPAFPLALVAGEDGGASKTSTFIVFTRLTGQGRKTLRDNPEWLEALQTDVGRLGARITHLYQVLGEYDFVALVEALDNTAAAQIAREVSNLGSVRLNVYPAIALDRFVPLLRQKAYRTEPHTWQTQLWARALRDVGRYWVMSRHVRQFCRPLAVEGRERIEGVRGPVLIIANHSSHFDTPALLYVLPPGLRARTAVAAAADRFYRATKRNWWFSLFWNTFPIKRGGGMAALDYPMSMIKRGWSILIYPEGGRSKPGEVQRFRHGVTIMAQLAKVPVLPVYMEGLGDIMPKGTRTPRPAPVRVRFGAPVSLDGVESVPEGTALLENAMRALAGLRERS